MTKLDVAYGLPTTFPEERLLARLQAVTNEFDESPTHMHVVLGPAERGVRWLAFASSSIGANMALAQEAFVDMMALAELIVVVRTIYSDTPQVARAGDLTVERRGAMVRVYGALPPGARRDGDVDEILLDALGLSGAIRPFDALARPTHEVVLRRDNRRVAVREIAPFSGKVFPVHVNPNLEVYGSSTEEFAAHPRAVEATDSAISELVR